MDIEILPIKTRVVRPPKDDISDIIDSLTVKEGDIVFVSSKILAIAQGRTKKTSECEKIDLIKQNAERFANFSSDNGEFHTNLTVVDGILMAGAGIDESNADGYYVMWPKNIDAICKNIREKLTRKFGIKNLGVVATDSHTTPLRWGVTGLTIGISGVKPLKDIRGEEDIFGRKMHLTQVNKVDPLASLAVLKMGESSEQTPIMIIRGDTGIEFDENASMDGFKIPLEMDMYQGIIKHIPKV